VAPGSLVRWLDEALLERVVFAPARRVEVGCTARLYSAATRRAIELRDRQCSHPYCDVPAASCQVDHIIPFSEGGPTVEENGRLLCGFHNRQRNHLPFPDD
jgi:5-methylcytosine-specific restriction endonuclease McrA